MDLPQSKIEYIREVMIDIIQRRTTTQPNNDLYQELIKTCCSIIFPLVSNEIEVRKIWENIRSNGDEYTKYILTLTHEFMFRCFDQQDMKYEEFVDIFTTNFAYLSSPASLIDNSCLNDIYGNVVGKNIYLNNPWLTMLMVTDTVIAGMET